MSVGSSEYVCGAQFYIIDISIKSFNFWERDQRLGMLHQKLKHSINTVNIWWNDKHFVFFFFNFSIKILQYINVFWIKFYNTEKWVIL